MFGIPAPPPLITTKKEEEQKRKKKSITDEFPGTSRPSLVIMTLAFLSARRGAAAVVQRKVARGGGWDDGDGESDATGCAERSGGATLPALGDGCATSGRE